jgi:hypothetical protein
MLGVGGFMGRQCDPEISEGLRATQEADFQSVHGAPLFPSSDNGPEAISRAILEGIAESGIATALTDPRQALEERNQRELQWQVPR